MADPNAHAGTIADPIPQQLLYKNAKDGKIYTVAGAASSSSAPAPKVENANETTKGITKLSDAIDSDSDAATGVTAATPKAVKDALEQAKAYTDANSGGTGTIVVDATDTVKGISKLSDATDSTLDASTGKTAATPKAVKDAMNVAKLALAQAGGVVTPDTPPKVELPGTIIEAATDKKIGTVKLSDATNSSSDAATGKTAASSKAVMEAMDKAKEALRVAQAGGGGQIVSVEDATDAVKGIVSLSDATDSELDAATGKFAATPKAVKAAMDKANEALALAGGNLDGNPIEGTKIESATDTKLGVTKLSDETASNADAATGTTAATPKAVMKAYDLANKAFKLAEANAGTASGGSIALPDDADATTKGVVKLSDAVNSDSDVDGLTAATPKAVKTALEQAKAYTDTLGGTGTSADATDTIKGINKLSDALDSDLNAATGATAATPLAVKQVNTKVTTLEQTSQDHGNRLDALESGGSGGGMNYVVTPKILTPTNGAVGQNTRITITGSGYENVFPTDARKHRIFELSKARDFGTKLETKEADADSIKFDTQLNSQTKYYARIKDVSQKEYHSNWSPVVEFTTGDVTHANTPVITLKGFADSPTDIGSGLTIEGGAYSVNDSSADTHKATSWSIRLKNGRANVWESLNDETHKTSIEVPKGTLQKTTAYVVTVIYHSTNFNDSSPAEQEFTTSNDFGTVQAPVITISGEPNKILETPSFSGGVFSCTRDPDTHESTEIQVIKSQDQSTVWRHTVNSATTLTIPKGILTVSTQYKVKMRYKGQSYGWSAWTEKDFTTAAEFVRYFYIGVPGTSTFGVGLATDEVLNNTIAGYNLEKLTNTEKPNDFQYGLYHTLGTGYHTNGYKCIPKFYFAYLQKDRDGTNLNDSELDALLPYVEVTKEQMKEAQRRSPYNAIVIAPADAFVDRNDAQQHGFILPRGFIDGGKEKLCFFITNSMSLDYSTDGWETSVAHGISYFPSESLELMRCDGKSIGGWGNTNYANLAALLPTTSSNINVISIFAWSAICLISLAQGQYATSTNDCAWYDSSLQTNYPKGINNTNVDVDDSTVRINTSMTAIKGDAFVDESAYAKTTHNGSINGITHVNGWLYQPTVGVSGLNDGNYILKESVALKDITSSNVEDKSLYDKVSFNIPNGYHWGKTNKSPLFREASGEKWALIGAFSDDAGVDSQSSTPTEFGKDYHYRNAGYAVSLVGGYWNYGVSAGLFCRYNASWSSSDNYYGARLMAYPNV